MAMTKLTNLINPQVMADAVNAKLPKAIKFSRIAKVDNTLEGVAGNTITVPKFAYIGDAENVAEGVALGTTTLTASTTTVTVKKAGKAVEITDEAILSGYGDPVGEATNQLTLSVASKIDDDCVDALSGASLMHDGSAANISYTGIVDAVDLLQEEVDAGLTKIIYVHPKQVTQLRKDADFRDLNKYPMPVIMNGTIGAIAGCQVVVSKRVKEYAYYKDNTNGTITIVADATDEDSTNKHLATITAAGCFGSVSVGDKVTAVTGGFYLNPIIVTVAEDPNNADNADKFAEENPALTIYLKRGVQLEEDRDVLKHTSVIVVDEHYTVALSNDSKVVLAKFKAA